MKKWIIYVVIFIVIIILAIIVIYRPCLKTDPCHPTWTAVVKIDTIKNPLSAGMTVYTMYKVTVNTAIDRTLEVKSTDFTFVTTRPMHTSIHTPAGTTEVWDSLEIVVDPVATHSNYGVVCVSVNEVGCEIPSFNDCIPVKVVP